MRRVFNFYLTEFGDAFLWNTAWPNLSYLSPAQRGVAMFSVMSVCVSVSMSVKTITPVVSSRNFQGIALWSKRQTTVQQRLGVRGWWFNDLTFKFYCDVSGQVAFQLSDRKVSCYSDRTWYCASNKYDRTPQIIVQQLDLRESINQSINQLINTRICITQNRQSKMSCNASQPFRVQNKIMNDAIDAVPH